MRVPRKSAIQLHIQVYSTLKPDALLHGTRNSQWLGGSGGALGLHLQGVLGTLGNALFDIG